MHFLTAQITRRAWIIGYSLGAVLNATRALSKPAIVLCDLTVDVLLHLYLGFADEAGNCYNVVFTHGWLF